MAKTLVVKGVNFSENKLDTVTWDNNIPCTVVSLNKNTAEIKYGNTETLVATPIPANTTDSILWESSDENVATVANGTVTVVGLGEVTITVICGNQSAACAIAVTADIDTSNVYKLSKYRLAGASAASGENGIGLVESSLIRGVIFSTTGAYEIPWADASTDTAHPYKIPNNTTHIKITVPSGVTVYRIGWFNDATTVVYHNTNYAKLIGISENFTPVNNVVQVAVPEYDGFSGINSIVVSFQYGDSQFVDSLFDDISVEFLHIDSN